jgi:hypothetical protein
MPDSFGMRDCKTGYLSVFMFGNAWVVYCPLVGDAMENQLSEPLMGGVGIKPAMLFSAARLNGKMPTFCGSWEFMMSNVASM